MTHGWSTRSPRFGSACLGRGVYLTGMILGSALAFTIMTGTALALSLPEPTPTESVQSVIDDLVGILANQDMNQPARSEERLHEIERTLRHHVNYGAMARRSLGHPWSELTEIEQQVFANLFIQFLARSVAAWSFNHPLENRRNEYLGQLVTYLSERHEGRYSEVSTKIRSMKVDTQLDFRLVKQGADWSVYDVVADYISVSDNYRARVANILRLFSFAELETAVKTMPLFQLLERTLKRR